MKSRGKAIHVPIARIGEQRIVLTAISVFHCHHILISPRKLKNDEREYTPKRKWRIECTEEKLRLIANSVEDITRFIGGQPQMMYCLSLFDHGNEIGEYMHQNLRPMMHPNMTSDCVGWNGRCTDNKYVRHNVAQGYATYKSPRRLSPKP